MTNGTGITGLTEREEEIVGLLSRAYESLMLDAKVMDLHKQNGGTVETLRITLNGEASADLEREEIEQSGRPAEEIAAEASEILRQQLYWFVQEAYRL